MENESPLIYIPRYSAMQWGGRFVRLGGFSGNIAWVGKGEGYVCDLKSIEIVIDIDYELFTS